MRYFVALVLVFMVFMSLLVMAETQNNRVFHINSWKKGKEKIEEVEFSVELDKKSPKFEKKLKNMKGEEKYKLEIFPGYGKSKNEIESWNVSLKSGFLHKELLSVTEYKDTYQDYFNYQDYIGVFELNNYFMKIEEKEFNPENYTFVPLLDKRSVSIESFTVYFQAEDFKFSDENHFLFDSIKIKFIFMNN